MLDGGADGFVATLAAFVSVFLFSVTGAFFAVELAFRVGPGCRGDSGSDFKVFGTSLDTVEGVMTLVNCWRYRSQACLIVLVFEE